MFHLEIKKDTKYQRKVTMTRYKSKFLPGPPARPGCPSGPPGPLRPTVPGRPAGPCEPGRPGAPVDPVGPRGPTASQTEYMREGKQSIKTTEYCRSLRKVSRNLIMSTIWNLQPYINVSDRSRNFDYERILRVSIFINTFITIFA